MAASLSDRSLWIGVGLGASLVTACIYKVLALYRDTYDVKAPAPLQVMLGKQINHDVENEIKAETLDRLLDSSNYSIRELAVQIVQDRAVRDPKAVQDLLWHISRPEYELRERGLRALRALPVLSYIRVIHQPAAYAALVQCLEYCVTDYEHNEWDPAWDNWNDRDEVEKHCLQILSWLVEYYGVEGLIKSDFISRWLKKEPWGGSQDMWQSGFFSALNSRQKLSNIMVNLFEDKEGTRQLKQHGLLPSLFPDDHSANPREYVSNVAATEFQSVDMSRPRDRSMGPAEDDIRRRHREAMVFNDGTRPFHRSDIIER